MNRAVVRLLASSSRIVPRVYASTVKPTSDSHAADAHHHDDHAHHDHHHEPELRKNQAWRHHAGLQSKYENQSEDPTITFTQGNAEWEAAGEAILCDFVD